MRGLTPNVGLIRRAFDAYTRGDIDGVLALCADDILITQTPEVAATGVPTEQHGHDGVLEAFGIWPNQWDDFEIEIQRIVADPGDHVVVSTLQRGRGKQSGVEVEAEFFFTFAVRDGKVAEWRIFFDEAEALAATRPGG
ncbi:MAG: nuclear transport factor 2 family protein [Thermoleophilaceae bacterium]